MLKFTNAIAIAVAKVVIATVAVVVVVVAAVVVAFVAIDLLKCSHHLKELSYFSAFVVAVATVVRNCNIIIIIIIIITIKMLHNTTKEK